MLRINRLRIEINTVNGVYGIDTPFSSGLNFIASEDNTCGKSSTTRAMSARSIQANGMRKGVPLTYYDEGEEMVCSSMKVEGVND